MKKLLILVFFLPVVLSSQTLVSTLPENKKIVLEEYTGFHCGNCPAGHLLAQQIYDNNPGNAFIIAIHTGSFASPSLLEPDFRIDPIGSTLASTFGVNSYPAATINRHLFSSNNSVSMPALGSNLSTASSQILTESSPVNVGVQASVDSTNMLIVDVEIYYTGSQTIPINRLNVGILQHNVEGPQSGSSNNPSAILPNGNYNHQHMLRHLITGQWGETINTINAGSFVQRQYLWQLPNDINGVDLDPTNLSVIAFVSESNSEILSASECSVNYNNPSWDCINNSCVFDNTGNGQFTSLNDCQNICEPSWDCVSNNCIDPGNNTGQYSLIATCLTNCVATTLSKTKVPDNNFENFLEFAGMGDGILGNDSVFTALIDTVTELLIPNLFISDLTGIEDFLLLETLDCQDNLLDSLDLSQNTTLTSLWCTNNQLTFLDVSNSLNLFHLTCADNQLTTLDVTPFPLLGDLNCQDNDIPSLNVTQNPNLYRLIASFNPLQSINLSNNISLRNLDIDEIGISSLDVSNNDSLYSLSCRQNQLTHLDLSQNVKLQYLNCSNNYLDYLDLRNGNNFNMTTSSGNLGCHYCFNLTNNPNLTCINVDSASWADSNWTVQNSHIDSTHYFSTECENTFDCVNNICVLDTIGEPNGQYLTLIDCQNNCIIVTPTWDCINGSCMDPGTGNGSYTSLADCQSNCIVNSILLEKSNTKKELIKVMDLLGRETKQTNQPLLYLYDDGTVEKRIIIE